MKNMKKIAAVLFLTSIMPFCFAGENQKELTTQDLLKKHLLGNSIQGAAACFMLGVLSSLPVFGVSFISAQIMAAPLIDLTVKNLTNGSGGLTVLFSGFSTMKYSSAFVVPYAIGFELGRRFIIPRLQP